MRIFQPILEKSIIATYYSAGKPEHKRQQDKMSVDMGGGIWDHKKNMCNSSLNPIHVVDNHKICSLK